MMPVIADLIDRVLSNPEDENVIAEVRAQVNKYMESYPIFAW
jgi:glycine hydroxymethyltransferase